MPLFTRPFTVQIVLDTLLCRQQQHNWRIYGYVILENHLHLLVQVNDLPNQLAHFKSYTARQLIDYLQAVKAERLLQKLDYIHQNPVKRGYADLPEHWRYSSARNYAGQEGLLAVLSGLVLANRQRG